MSNILDRLVWLVGIWQIGVWAGWWIAGLESRLRNREQKPIFWEEFRHRVLWDEWLDKQAEKEFQREKF